MGRAEKRKIERRNRIEENKDKVVMTKQELAKLKQDIRNETSAFTTEALMTCMALKDRRLRGYGQKRIMDDLQYVDELMGPIMSGEKTIDDYKRALREESNVVISCDVR